MATKALFLFLAEMCGIDRATSSAQVKTTAVVSLLMSNVGEADSHYSGYGHEDIGEPFQVLPAELQALSANES